MDEGDSVGFARMDWPAFLHLLNVREVNMALYYVFLRGWIHFGDSEAFLRLPSVIFGTIAVLATCIFGARVHSRSVGLMAGIFLSFNVLAIRYTHEVRSYALFFMLVALSWVAYERAVRLGTRRDMIIWVVVSALGVYAHIFAVLAFVSQLACLVFAEIGSGRRKVFAIASVAYFALILPLAVIILRMKEDPLSWVRPLGRDVFAMLAEDFFSGGAVQIALAILLLAASMVMLINAPREQRWGISTAVFGTLVPIVIVILVSIVKPLLIPRFMLVALPSYAVAIAMVLDRLPRKASVVAVCVIIILGLPSIRDYEREPAWNDFRDTVAYVAERAQSGDAIIIWSPLARPAVEYYAARRTTGRPFPEIVFPGAQRPLIAEDIVSYPVPHDIDALCDKYRRIWILYGVDFAPDRYYVWHTFFVRRVSINHRLVSKIVIPGRQGAQVMEFERP